MNPLLVRNFVIIAHIDHGKSTLADRFLELTKTVEANKMRCQYLDQMDLERERGITIKMQPVRMHYSSGGKDYILNLIDTPGHVDFSYEVSRSLAAVEGAILLVDGTRGIQAQTLSHLELAKQQKLVMIPVINKIDSPQIRLEETRQELSHLLGVEPEEILTVSAKSGVNVAGLLEEVIKKIPPPPQDKEGQQLRALIFDSHYDPFKGIVAYIRVMDGSIKTNDRIKAFVSKTENEAKEVGYFQPQMVSQKELLAGEIGYIATGIKEPERIRVGDTVVSVKVESRGSNVVKVEPLPGYKEPKPMVFASLYPQKAEDFELFKKSLSQLKLNDAALTFEPEFKKTLGQGFRCGFLGLLHAEIVTERLSREFRLDVIISTPSVVYKIINQKDEEILIYSPTDWPLTSEIQKSYEPWVNLEVVTPTDYWGQTMEALQTISGEHIDTQSLSDNRVVLVYEVPLREIMTGFYDRLKGATRGYASMNYTGIGYREGNLAKLEILIAGQTEEAFCKIVPREKAYQEGSALVKKLKNAMPPQLFSVALQAVIEGKIIAREDITVRRKDVTASLYGGDYSRKRKLLEKQKKGKKKLKEKGKIKIPQKVFLEMFKK